MATQADLMRIIDYFGSNSSIYQKIQLGTATDSEISYALSQIPRMQVDLSASGSTLGYSYSDPVYTVPYQGMDIVTDFDSNGGQSSFDGVRGNFPISFGRDSGGAYIEAGRAVSTGQKIMAVVDKAALAVTGVNIGAKLGKKIDELIYNTNPEWWDTHYPTINPQTWPSIVGESETGEFFFRTFFGIEDDGTTTAYIDEDVFTQTYQMLRDLGMWEDTPTITPGTAPKVGDYITNEDFTILPNDTVLEGGYISGSSWTYDNNYRGYKGVLTQHSSGEIIHISAYQGRDAYISSTGPYRVTAVDGRGFVTITPPVQFNNTTPSQRFVFQRSNNSVSWGTGGEPSATQVSYVPVSPYTPYYLIRATVKIPGIEGITDIDGATQYPPTTITGGTLDEVKQQLKQAYPDLFDDAITETVLQPDGSTITKTYVPVPWQIDNPTDLTQTSPVTKTDPSTSTQIDPQVAPDLVTQTGTTIAPPPDIDTPDTGDGVAEASPAPAGSASSLWAVYNPTQAQLNAFGGWLWSSNFVDQLKKLFNDPMQAIIGVHKVFATPPTSGSQSIVCGYLDSGVSSAVVSSQYTTVDCGSVNMQEYFGNVFDYSPYTDVKLYLPFIGIVPLDVDYVMRSRIGVKYTVDVITGACLAEVNVSRDGGGGTLFTYGGSAIVSYPISSGSYVGVVSGALSMLAGVAGTIASGGSALPATMGALSGIGKMHTSVQHSGQFTGSAGAMGHKKPYLIISRPQTRVANRVDEFAGKPSNVTMRIGDCIGYTKVDEVHLTIPTAYDSEMAEIVQMLKAGVII